MSADNKWWGWYRTKMDVVPIRFLQAVNVPVLFVWGESDELVPVNTSYDLVKEKGKEKKVEYKIFRNADHSLYNGGAKPVHIELMQEWLTKNL
jgi:dipeptidyl aminopeptidase/acylaminoacyl peptidase